MGHNATVFSSNQTVFGSQSDSLQVAIRRCAELHVKSCGPVRSSIDAELCASKAVAQQLQPCTLGGLRFAPPYSRFSCQSSVVYPGTYVRIYCSTSRQWRANSCAGDLCRLRTSRLNLFPNTFLCLAFLIRHLGRFGLPLCGSVGLSARNPSNMAMAAAR